MSTVYRNIRSLAARTVYSLHPRSIAWQLKHARGPAHPVITGLGWSGNLRVRIYSNDVIAKCVYQWGIFEESEARLVTRFLKPGMVFFDVGANFGQYTVLAAERVGAEGRVHSFEPSARMYGELSFNVELNNLQSRCVLNNVALSDREGIARLSRYEAGAEVYGSIGTQHWAEERIMGHDEVTTTTLDEYIARHRIERVDLIKMDIEGAEWLALRGGECLLSKDNAPAIVVEMVDKNTEGFGYKALDVWNYLESLGYQLYEIDKRGHRRSEASRPPDNLLLSQNFFAAKPSAK